VWVCWGMFGLAWVAGAVYNRQHSRPCGHLMGPQGDDSVVERQAAEIAASLDTIGRVMRRSA
jgi:hypothetical protein